MDDVAAFVCDSLGKLCVLCCYHLLTIIFKIVGTDSFVPLVWAVHPEKSEIYE